MKNDGNTYVIDSIRHSLTARQVLEQLLWAFRQQRNAKVWVVVQPHERETWPSRIRVALARERKRLREMRESTAVEVFLAKQFTIQARGTGVPIANGLHAILFEYHQSRQHRIQQQLAGIVREALRMKHAT